MIVDSAVHPERNLYFVGAKQFELLKAGKQREMDVLLLFKQYNSANRIPISFDYHLLGLDWLFLLGLIRINENGALILCS